MSLARSRPDRTVQASDPLDLRWVTSDEEMDAVYAVRAAVFRDEQGLVNLDLSDPDETRSRAMVAYWDGAPVATARLTPPGDHTQAYISWVATLPPYRRRGIASALMQVLLAAADGAGYPHVLLSAQTHAVHLYADLGFRPRGSEFVVRGIPHQGMIRPRFGVTV